jgi:hypothetical protein
MEICAENPVGGLGVKTEPGHEMFGLKTDLVPGSVPLIFGPIVVWEDTPNLVLPTQSIKTQLACAANPSQK